MTSTVQALNPTVRINRTARERSIANLRHALPRIPWNRRGAALMVLAILEDLQADPRELQEKPVKHLSRAFLVTLNHRITQPNSDLNPPLWEAFRSRKGF